MSVIAVTGATGFVGREFVRQLEKQGHTLKLLVRSPEKLSTVNEHMLVKGDLDNKRALGRLCKGTDVLVHIAGLITARNEAEFMQANVEGTKNLSEIAARAGVKRVILISSLAAREAQLSAYAKSKYGGENALIDHSSGMPYVILRPPAVYGSGDEGTFPLLKAMTQRYAIIPGQKHSRISLIHVSDLTHAMIKLITAPLEQINQQVFEIHDGRKHGYSWSEMAHMAGLIEKKAVECIFLPRLVLNIIAGACMLYGKVSGQVPFLSFDKVKELYHEDWICRHNLLNKTGLWKAKINFSDGFEKTIKWYRVNGWLS